MSLKDEIEAAKKQAAKIHTAESNEMFDKGYAEVRKLHCLTIDAYVTFEKDGKYYSKSIAFSSEYVDLAEASLKGEIRGVDAAPYHRGIMQASCEIGVENLRDHDNNYRIPSRRTHVLEGSIAGFHLLGELNSAKTETLLQSLLKKKPGIASELEDMMKRYYPIQE